MNFPLPHHYAYTTMDRAEPVVDRPLTVSDVGTLVDHFGEHLTVNVRISEYTWEKLREVEDFDELTDLAREAFAPDMLDLFDTSEFVDLDVWENHLHDLVGPSLKVMFNAGDFLDLR